MVRFMVQIPIKRLLELKDENFRGHEASDGHATEDLREEVCPAGQIR